MDKPKIRFQGFEEAWSQKTLGEIAEFYSGGTPQVGVKEYYNGNIPFIRSAEINCKKTELCITESGLMNSSAKLVEKGSILYALYGATSGEVGISRISGAINQAILAILPIDGYDKKYIMYWLRKNKKNITDTYLQGGQGNLSGAIIKGLNMALPNSHNEQKKIGKLFQRIDHLLNLQQRKCDKLKDIKKSMLTKMFPKPGKKVPEVRFKGFTDDWVECFIKDVCNIATGLSNTQDQTKNGIYPFFIRSDKPLKSNKYLYDCEAVITIGDGNIGKVFHYINGKFDLHQRCYKMTDFRYVIGKYFFYYFSTHFYERVIKMSAKATVDSVRLEMISDMKLLYPVDIKEQKLIANFFYKLDTLIRLSELRLDKLRLLKRSFLEGMFV